MTQVQKAEKYIVVKVMKISDGSAQKALREFGPGPPRGQRVAAAEAPVYSGGAQFT